MKRLVPALAVLALVASSCAVGVRQPASEVSETSAVLNGKVVSTTGGPGTYYFLHGPAESLMRATDVGDVDFEAGESHPVSEPVDGLEPGTTYRYRVCAGDSENPDGHCSPTQTYETAGTGVAAFNTHAVCADPDDFSQEGVVLNFEPVTDYGLSVEFIEGGSGSGGTFFTSDEAGNAGVGNIVITQPFRVHVVIWLNPDLDLVQDPGEETVVDEIYAADEPCTNAEPEEPTPT